MVVFEGEYTFTLDQSPDISLKPYQAILFPPHVTQDWILDDGFDSGHTFWAHFHPEASMLELLDWPSISQNPAILEWTENEDLHKEILAACHRCNHYLESQYRRKRSLALLSLEEILRLLNQVNPQGVLDSLDDRIVAALQYIATNIRERIAIKDIAHDVGLSPSRLSHVFSKEIHCNVGDYIERQRIKMAVGMLANTSLPITEIASICGFNSAFYFSRRFHKSKGMSPSDYRKTHTI